MPWNCCRCSASNTCATVWCRACRHFTVQCRDCFSYGDAPAPPALPPLPAPPPPAARRRQGGEAGPSSTALLGEMAERPLGR